MRKHLLVAAASLILIGGTLAAPVQALSPRQEKMKDCAAKWKEEKAQKHVSGRDAYRAFMRECLKG